MTINRTAYETTACNGFMLKKTTDALAVAKAYGHLGKSENGKFFLVEGGGSEIDAVPTFAHPLVYANELTQATPNNNATPELFIDVRSFGRWDTAQNKFNVRNEIEYKLACHRTTLNSLWLTESPTILRDISQLPMAIYASWISEAVARRFALDPREQMDLSILAAVFYNSNFTNEKELDERDKLRVVNTISRALRVSTTDVLSVMDNVTQMPNIISFCQHAESVTNSVRLKELNAGILFSILGGTWFGTNAKEMIAVATEHPPTWLTILMAAYSERSFKNSAITKLTERSGNKDIGKGYMHSMLNLLATCSK